MFAHKGSKAVGATGRLVVMRNNGPSSTGAVSTFQSKVGIATVPQIFERVLSVGAETAVGVVSNLYREVAPPLIAANGVAVPVPVPEKSIRFWILTVVRESIDQNNIGRTHTHVITRTRKCLKKWWEHQLKGKTISQKKRPDVFTLGPSSG